MDAFNRVQSVGEFSDLTCDCGHGLVHDHKDCKSAYRCARCGITDYYDGARPQLVMEGDRPDMIFVCRYCNSPEYTLWNSYEEAKAAEPQGCQCANNGDYCPFCQILLTEPEEGRTNGIPTLRQAG